MTSKDSDASLAHHFEDLIRYYNNEDFDKALKSVNIILKENPADQKALHSKAVCLIQLSKFAEALEALKNIKIQEDVLLLKVYALYRLGRFNEIITSLPAQDLSLELKEIKAQTLYKLERYEECLELYKDLLKKQRDDLDTERQSNLLAVLTQLQLLASSSSSSSATAASKFTPSAPETYELVFNSASLDMARGDFAEAEKKFRRAQVLFQQFSEEEKLSAEKIKAEMITLKTQLVSCLLRKKRQQPTGGQEKLTGFNLDSVESNFLNQFAKLKKKSKKETEKTEKTEKTETEKTEKTKIQSPKTNPTGKTNPPGGAAGKKRRSKRKPRLPKNYDPNVKPDPERWLPKIERSNFKKKKDKRGNLGINKGTQGSTAQQPDTTAPSTPKAQHSAGPRQQKPQAATKKQAKKRPKK